MISKKGYDMSIVSTGDTLVFDSGHKVKVDSIKYDSEDVSGMPYLVNNVLWLSPIGETDPLSSKTSIVKAVINGSKEEDVETETVTGPVIEDIDSLLQGDLPEEMSWTFLKPGGNKKKYSKYDPLYNLLQKHSHRAFAVGEIGVLYYRVFNKTANRETIASIIGLGVASKRLERVSYGRYRGVLKQ